MWLEQDLKIQGSIISALIFSDGQIVLYYWYHHTPSLMIHPTFKVFSLQRLILEFECQCESICHCEHAQIDSSVSVQLLVQLIDGHSVFVIGGWIQHISTPQHLQDP